MPRPLRLHLPPATGDGDDHYTPWFLSGIDLALSPAEAGFLRTIIDALSEGTIDPVTACFAEADFFIGGWHPVDLPTPDLTKLHAAWALIFDTLLGSRT